MCCPATHPWQSTAACCLKPALIMANSTSPTLVPARSDCLPELAGPSTSATWPKVASEAQKKLPYAKHVVLGDSASVDEGTFAVSTCTPCATAEHGNTSGHHAWLSLCSGSLLIELSKLGPDVDALTLSSAGLEHACVVQSCGVAVAVVHCGCAVRCSLPCAQRPSCAPHARHTASCAAGLSKAPLQCCCCPAACPA